MNSEESTWPKLDRPTIAIAVVPKLKMSKVVLGLLSARSVVNPSSLRRHNRQRSAI